MSSVNRTPGILVGMVEKGPRISEGASGLGSQRSIWLGPPQLKIIITRLAFALSAATAPSQGA